MLKRFALIFLLLAVFITLVGEEEEEIGYKELAEIVEKSHMPENDFKEVFSKKDYLGHIFDSKGYLWYMTQSVDYYEVYRYDNHLSELILQLEIKHNDIYYGKSLFELDSGQMVIVIEDYFYVWDNYKFNKFDLLSDESIIYKAQVKDKLLAVGDKGYYIYQNNKFKSFNYHQDMRNFDISSSVVMVSSIFTN